MWIIRWKAGKNMPASRENYALKQGEKRHVARFGRAPAYIRAAALIYWSARPDMYDRSPLLPAQRAGDAARVADGKRECMTIAG